MFFYLKNSNITNPKLEDRSLLTLCGYCGFCPFTIYLKHVPLAEDPFTKELK
jgi:hypothetical protein